MFRKKKHIALNKLVLFSSQLNNLLQSGLSLTSALSLLQEQDIVPGGQDILLDLQKGKKFSEALDEAQFPALFVSFIRAAEEHGDYAFGLSQCETYFSSREKWIRETKQACTYPLFILSLIVIALFFMLTMVLPRFQDLYSTMGIELPWITQSMLSLFHALSDLVWILAIIMVILLFVIFLQWKKGEWIKFAMRMPGLSQFMKYYFTHYISIQLGSLLQSGVPLLTSLNVVEQYTPWSALREYLGAVKVRLLEGNAFYQAMRGHEKYFLPSFSTMITIGEKSGQLDIALLSMARGTENILKTKMNRFVQGLEPLLILCIGCFIALAVVSMFLPMLQLVRAL